LLPDWTLVRRAYEAATIRLVVTEHAHGMGYRRIALRSGYPSRLYGTGFAPPGVGRLTFAIFRVVQEIPSTQPSPRLNEQS
jgi:hypothetical protein